MITVNVNEAYHMLASSAGRFFSVKFIKANGKARNMVCRTGVRRYLRGGSTTYNPAQHRNLIVFDVQKGGYRTIPCGSIITFKKNGIQFVVAGN
jgi:hypothetical protein